MPLDIDTPDSPGWWLKRLALKLEARRPDVDKLEALFKGDHPLPIRDDEDAEKFRSFQKIARSNYLSLVVEAAVERMRVVGIRAGEDSSGDGESWKRWQRASLDADQVLIHRTMLALRRAYILVTPHPRKRGEVLISPEDPRDVITEAWPDDRRDVRAALVLKLDGFGRQTAWLYLLDGVYVFQGPKNSSLNEPTARINEGALRSWQFAAKLPNPTPGEIPVVEFANRPGLRGQASSEFEDVIDIQNRINATLLHRLVAEKFAVLRQLAILNLEFDEDDEGNAIAPVLPKDASVAWLLQGEHLEMWESSQTSTADILRGVETDIRDLAALTRTPPHYLLNSIVNASGDALKSAETGLVSKVREHIAQASDSWERVIYLVHRVANIPLDVDRLEVVWADPESRSLAELHDAAVKAVTSGVPWSTRMEMLGYSPLEISRMEAERVQDALLASLAQPPAPSDPATTAEQDEEEEDPPEEDAA